MCKTFNCKKVAKKFKTDIITKDRQMYSITYPDSKLDSLNKKKEKSRLAAQKRRNQENINLADLYLSLPVAPESRLLSCDDNDFIGNFEKTTIIKVSAYVLKLYNSLSESRHFEIFQKKNYPIMSLFSQSMFGLFWCEDSSKLVFTTPGLARLTGLYWCNIIGMPLSSIIIDSADRKNFSIPSNMIYLRFMKESLKDRGIFTVQPSKVYADDEDIPDEKKGSSSSHSTKKDIGKIACSVWSSAKMKNGMRFDLIQPLFTKPEESSRDILPVISTYISIHRLRTNTDPYTGDAPTYRPFSTYHDIDSYLTIGVEREYLAALGYQIEDFENTTLLSFFLLDDIVPVNYRLQKLISGKTKIDRCMVRMCTSRLGIYRWCLHTLQITGDLPLTPPKNLASRPSGNQGEAYSQSLANALTAMNEASGSSKSAKSSGSNLVIQSTYCLCNYYSENGSYIIDNIASIDLQPRAPRRPVIGERRNAPDQFSSMFDELLEEPPMVNQAMALNFVQTPFSLGNNQVQMSNQHSDNLSYAYKRDYSGSSVMQQQQQLQQQQQASQSQRPRLSILEQELMKPRSDKL